MRKAVKIRVKAQGDSDAPTVEDLLDQLRDFFAILDAVEEAISESASSAIQWRIVRASTNSPLEFEAQAFAREFAVNVDHRATLVLQHTALGMRYLRDRGERPPFFTDRVLRRAEQLFERVTNGLDQTIIEYGDGLPTLKLTPAIAREAAAKTRTVLRPPDKPYSEVGSIEGTTRSIDRDGHGHLVLWIHHRLTGEDVKCFISGQAEKELGDRTIRDVWRGRRVQASGTIRYKGLGRIDRVDACFVRFLKDRAELPDIGDILDPDFTGGLRSEDYIARLRDGELN